MKIRLVPKKNPQKREEVKFYANPVNLGHKSLDDIARDIAGRSSLTRGDVSNVLYNFIDCLPHYLRDGFSIQLGEFGSMRVTLSSKGAEKEEEFKTATIKPRVVFTPGGELKRELAANSYETVRKKEEADKDKKKEDKKKNGGGSGPVIGKDIGLMGLIGQMRPIGPIGPIRPNEAMSLIRPISKKRKKVRF